MKIWKIRQYLPAFASVRPEACGGRGGAVISVRTRDVCGVDRRCCMAVHWLMTRLIERGLARRLKRGTYLIERAAVEEVLTALRQRI